MGILVNQICCVTNKRFQNNKQKVEFTTYTTKRPIGFISLWFSNSHRFKTFVGDQFSLGFKNWIIVSWRLLFFKIIYFCFRPYSYVEEYQDQSSSKPITLPISKIHCWLWQSKFLFYCLCFSNATKMTTIEKSGSKGLHVQKVF